MMQKEVGWEVLMRNQVAIMEALTAIRREGFGAKIAALESRIEATNNWLKEGGYE